MRVSATLHAVCCALLLAAAPSCGREPSPTSADALAGAYELRSVNGRAVPVDALGGAVSGRLVLTRDGRVTRTIRYATSGVPGPIEQRSTGTYEVTGSEVSYRVVDERSPEGTLPLEAQGELRARRLTFRYPAPGVGGGRVEEEYVRTGG